jgi:iron complex outermembrane recepter protein
MTGFVNRQGFVGLALAGTAALALCAAPAALAQETAQEASQGLGDIIVTARKFEENLQTTPVAVTALSAETIEAQSANNIGDSAQFIPNVSFNQGAATSGGAMNAEIYIRGVGQSDFLITVDPGVGLYVDGVYFARATGNVLDLLDIERLEVLRGPQGTLFGKNTIGGAFNFVSKKPNFNEIEGYGKATTGRFNRIDVQAVANLPLSDNAAIRISGITKNRDGFTKRVVAGDTQGDEDSLAGRAQLLWQPTDALSIDIAVDGTRKREQGANTTVFFVSPVYQVCGAVNGVGGTPYLACPDGSAGTPAQNLLGLWAGFTGNALPTPNRNTPFTNSGTGSNLSNLDNWGVSGTLTYDLENVSIKSITAYRDLKARFGRDGDNGPTSYIDTQQVTKQDQFSQEFQFTGQALDDRLNWLVGLFYFKEEATDDNVVRLAPGLYQALENLPGQFAGPGNPLLPCPAPLSAGPNAFPVILQSFGCMNNPANIGFDLDFLPFTEISTKSYAAFTQMSYKITEALSVTLGLRYTKEKKRNGILQVRAQSGFRVIGVGGERVTYPGLFSGFDANGAPIPIPDGFRCVPRDVCDPVQVKNSYDDWSPRVGLDYKINDDFFVYALVSKGFKAGGFNGRPTDEGGVSSFDPETLWSYEVGLKSEFLDNRVRLNVAGFYNDYKDIQLTSIEANSANQLIVAVRNAGKAEMYGVEAEMTALLAEGFRVNGSVGYLHNKFKEVPVTLPITIQLQKAPEWTASFGAQYEVFYEGVGKFLLRGDMNYRSSYFTDTNNTPEIKQGGYALVNARLAWTSENDMFEIAVFGTNLTDKRYIVTANSSLDSFGTAEGVVGRPREWGLSGTIKF